MRLKIPVLVKLLFAASILSVNFVVFADEAPCYMCANQNPEGSPPDSSCDEAPSGFPGYKECDETIETPLACGISLETRTCNGDLD